MLELMQMSMHALSFDVEDWYQGFKKRGFRDWKQYGSREVSNVNRVLDILDENQTNATFFVLAKLAEEQPEIVKAIVARGHEIASHSYSHLTLDHMNEKSFREDLLRSKKVLEDITGNRIAGFRAASYSMTRNTLWAYDALSDAGFVYDSSVFPTRWHSYGLPAAPCHPYFCWTQGEKGVWEFPAQVLKVGFLRLPIAGGFYLRALPFFLSVWAIRQSEKSNVPGQVYLHPYDMDPGIPVLQTSLSFRIIRYTNLKKTERRLRELLGQFRFCSIMEIVRSMQKPKYPAVR